MFIRMHTTACGPSGNRFADKVYEVDKAEGDELVKGGYAEVVSRPAKAAESIEKADAPATKGKAGRKSEDAE